MNKTMNEVLRRKSALTDGAEVLGLLDRAIGMLELRLRNSTKGPWQIDMGHYMSHARHSERALIHRITSDVDNYKGSMSRADADLIVALHRMAVPQLELLRVAHHYTVDWYVGDGYEPDYDREGPKEPWFLGVLEMAQTLVDGVDIITVAPIWTGSGV